MKTRIILLFVLTTISCTNKETTFSFDELRTVEKQFSQMSVEQGMVKAFTHFCDSTVVLLRQGSYPIVGDKQLAEYLSNIQDSLFTLSWTPTDGMIAKSGDLGYTYGTYRLSFKEENLPDKVGYYLTIWIKNDEGNWRFVMDTGQDGPVE